MALQPSAGTATAREDTLARRHPSGLAPHRMLDRFADEMERMFDDFGLGHAWNRVGSSLGSLRWTPQIEITNRNNELVVRADLPGLTKDDVKVDITDEAITLEGERRREHQEERAGVYRSERSYGHFYRMIPLPEGAKTDQAKAAFKDGVLEISMPAPPEQQPSRGRRLEISETSGRR